METLFSAVFNLFRSFLNLFQWFQAWNQQKTSEKEQKKRFCLLLKAGRHAKAGQLAEGVPWNCLFGWFFTFYRFSSVFHWFHSKKLKIYEKRLKLMFYYFSFLSLKTKKVENGWKKVFRPAFRCCKLVEIPNNQCSLVRLKQTPNKKTPVPTRLDYLCGFWSRVF